MFTALFVLLGMSTAYSAPLPPASPDAVVHCAIDAERMGQSVTLSPRIASDDGVMGVYTLAVTKSGPDGSAVLSQGGAFDTAAEDAGDVGEMTLTLEPGAALEATLRVEWNGGETFCVLGA